MNRTRLLVLVLALIVGASGLIAVTERASAQADERLLTLYLRDASLEDALSQLFRATPYSYTLAPGLGELEVTLDLNDVTFSQALRAILEMHNLTYRREAGNVYYITEKTEPPLRPTDGNGEFRPSVRQRLYWFGPGGRYEFQYLDCRQVAAWFGGWVAGPSIIPVPTEGTGGAGGAGGARGGAGGGGGARGGAGGGGGARGMSGGGGGGGGGGRGGGGGGGSGGGSGGGGSRGGGGGGRGGGR